MVVATSCVIAAFGVVVVGAVETPAYASNTYTLAKTQKFSATPSASFRDCQAKTVSIAAGTYDYAEFFGAFEWNQVNAFTLKKGSYYWQSCVYASTGVGDNNYKIFTILTNSTGSKSWDFPTEYFRMTQTNNYLWGSQIYTSSEV
jgi:hypothetical protein